jgi:hypothetical protein
LTLLRHPQRTRTRCRPDSRRCPGSSWS